MKLEDNPDCVLRSLVLTDVRDKVNRVLVCVDGDADHDGLKLKVDRLKCTYNVNTRLVWLVGAALITWIATRLPELIHLITGNG